MKFKKTISYSVIILGILLSSVVIIFINKPNTEKIVQQQSAPVVEVVVTPGTFIQVPQLEQEKIVEWETFTSNKLNLSLKHPTDVIIDERQTSEGKLYVFIFEEDSEKPLPGKVTALYVADTEKKGIDGFSAFRKGDCGKECKVSYKNVPWVNINNMYGVKNPMPGDVHNYFLTDKEQANSVINVYVGGYIDTKDEAVQEKIKVFEQMIQTIIFNK